MAGRVRVFIACSLDGFIAGPNDTVEWLTPSEPAEDTFSPFMAQVGAMLMGRRTYDVVREFEGPWPYGNTPVLVATHRSLAASQPTIRPVSGTIEAMVREAREEAGDKDVYLDGGRLIRSALDAGLVSEMTVTVVPVILGEGVELFVGIRKRVWLELVSERSVGAGMVELTYRPRGS